MKITVTNYLRPGNREKNTQKLTTKKKEKKNRNKCHVDKYIYKKALVCIWLYYTSQISGDDLWLFIHMTLIQLFLKTVRRY